MSTVSVLIPGANGFLGRHLSKMLREEGFNTVCLSHSELDITDPSSVRKALETHSPRIVVNCAAISSTSYAKEHPDESMEINVKGCVNLAQECYKAGIELYLISSDQVYGGYPGTEPISEDIELKPNNIYGEHKYLMEKEAIAADPDAKILRLPWMFESFNPEKTHQDYISNLLKARLEGTPIKACSREMRGITDVDTICANIIKSFGFVPGGVYNFGSDNRKTSYETLRDIAPAAGLKPEQIIEDSSWSRNLTMDCSKIGAFGIFFPTTQDSILNAIL